MKQEERLELALKYMKNTIGSEDTFRFHCTVCGECCKDRDDIILTPYDFYRLVRYLKQPMEEVFRDNCEWYVGPTSNLPVMVLRKREDGDKSCPFLKENRCSVHEAKPSVCALFPLGRALDNDSGKVMYFLQDLTCGLRDEEHTVREWLSVLDFPASEAWFMAWSKCISTLVEKLDFLQERLPREEFILTENALFFLLYTKYDMEKDFMEQFENNATTAKELLYLAEKAYQKKE